MKKVTTIFFLLLFFSAQYGYYIFYAVQQYIAREEARELLIGSLPDEALTVFSVKAEQAHIIWEEENKEFYRFGELYDVVKITPAGNDQFIYCINDKKEEAVLKDFSSAVKSGNDNTNNGKESKHSLKFQLSDYMLAESDNHTAIAPGRPAEHVHFNTLLPFIASRVNTPPPKADKALIISILSV